MARAGLLSVRFPALHGRGLDRLLTASTGSEELVVLVPPQPALGGDRSNNVVRGLARGLAARGLAALSFDYRGVGGSPDVDPTLPRFEYWRRVEEEGRTEAVLEDLSAAVAFARRLLPVRALVGYSFGAYVAARGAAAESLPLVAVAPPLRRIDFGDSLDRPSVLVVTAGEDALDPPPPPDELRASLPRARVVSFDGTDHFFRGEEDRLAGEVWSFLGEVAA